jgi:hypothetical protein
LVFCYPKNGIFQEAHLFPYSNEKFRRHQLILIRRKEIRSITEKPVVSTAQGLIAHKGYWVAALPEIKK